MDYLLPILSVVLPFMGWGLMLGISFMWLRHTITPDWVRQLFESEGEASVRLVLAPIVIVYTLFMQAAGRIGEGMVQANYLLAGTLLGLGTAKLVGKAFAHRPLGPATQVTAKKAEVNAESATVTGTIEPQP